MERAILLTGIGGQGVQLAARTLALAAVAEGRDATMFGEYAGSMRGGNSDSTVVIGTERLVTPPTVSHAWGAVAMHHEYWNDVGWKVSPGGVVLMDRSVFRGDLGRTDLTVVEVQATDTAVQVGNAKGGSMVILGALAAATGIIGVESLVAAATEALPPYRAQHAQANADAIRAGHGLVAQPVVDAWSHDTVEEAVGANR